MPLIAAALFYEHRSAARLDLAGINRAFFQSNAFVSAVFFAQRLGGAALKLIRARVQRCAWRGGHPRNRSSARLARSFSAISSLITRSPNDRHVGVVMLAGEPGGLLVPAERATDAAHLVRGHRLAVAGAAEDDRAIAFPARHRFGRRADELRVIDRCRRCRSRNPRPRGLTTAEAP